MLSEKSRKFEIPGLDGVRALAVCAVILFHAGFNEFMPGGYLGVDVFFALSGFLITTIILYEVDSNGSFSLLNFIKRRLKRLYPALLIVVVVSTIYALAFSQDAIKSIADDFLPSILYYSNIHQLAHDLPYFEQFGRPHPLQHLWSLAVEMHFYLIWPFVFLLYSPRFKERYKWFVIFSTIALTLWSIYFAIRLNIPLDVKPERFYFRTDTRVADIVFGALLALSFSPLSSQLVKPNRSLLITLLGWASLLLLLSAFAFIDESSFWLYRGGFTAVSLATCFLIVVASTGDDVLYRLFNSKPLVWIGERSYSLYLWHWPVFTFFRPGEELPDDLFVSFILRLLLTGALASLTYKYVEIRFKRGFFEAYGTISKFVYATFVIVSLTGAYYTYIYISDATVFVSNKPLSMDVSPSETSAHEDRDSFEVVGKKIKGYPLSLTDVRITAIGDSVLLGTRSSIERNLPIVKIDAVVGRQGSDALKLLKEFKSNGDLSKDVLLHIGTNGYIFEQHLKQMLDLLSDSRKVVIFNVHADRRWTSPNNALLRKYALLYPGFIFVDWNLASSDHPEYFVKDGVHLTGKGMLAFTRLAKDAFGVPDLPKDVIQSSPNDGPKRAKVFLKKTKTEMGFVKDIDAAEQTQGLNKPEAQSDE